MDRVKGFIDGIRDGDIVGWIANQTRQHAVEEIILQGNGDGKQIVFRPHFYRFDVARALGRHDNEVFGFAVPIDVLPREWKHLTFKTRLGNILTNGQIDISQYQKRSLPLDKCHIFLHIPKTAGTSLRYQLMRQIRLSQQCFLYPFATGSSVTTFNAIPLHQRRQFRLIMGHTEFGIHNYIGKPYRYISIIREPVARIKSLYWHKRRENVVEINIDGANVPLETAINNALLEEFDNQQVRILAGVGTEAIPVGQISESDLELAIRNIEQEFDFVGTLETLDKHAPVLFETVNLTFEALSKENVFPYHDDDERYQKLEWNRIKQRNIYDIMLHAYVSEKARIGGL